MMSSFSLLLSSLLSSFNAEKPLHANQGDRHCGQQARNILQIFRVQINGREQAFHHFFTFGSGSRGGIELGSKRIRVWINIPVSISPSTLPPGRCKINLWERMKQNKEKERKKIDKNG